MRVYLLSRRSADRPCGKAGSAIQSVSEIEGRFAGRAYTPSLLHVSPLEGLHKGRQYLSDINRRRAANKILHFVSDFRDKDWSGADTQKLKDEVNGILEDGVSLNFIDVAAPYRHTTGKVTIHHDNMALVDLKADTRCHRGRRGGVHRDGGEPQSGARAGLPRGVHQRRARSRP